MPTFINVKIISQIQVKILYISFLRKLYCAVINICLTLRRRYHEYFWHVTVYRTDKWLFTFSPFRLFTLNTPRYFLEFAFVDYTHLYFFTECARAKEDAKGLVGPMFSCDKITGNYLPRQMKGSMVYCADSEGNQISEFVHVSEAGSLQC